MQLRSLHVIQQSSVYHIWRGESAELNRRFTVKELRPETQAMDVHIAALKREAEFLSSYQHARLLAVVNHESPHIVFYEDVQCSLHQLMQKHGALSNERVALVISQCLEALAFLASKDQAHGMLCSENVFIDPAGFIKLGDFTGYRYERDRSAVGSFYKLPANLAPEVIDRDRGPCGPWSDLYCLGFIALEMLAGDRLSQLMGLSGHQNDPQRWRRWHADTFQSLNNWQEQLPDVSASLGEFIDGLIEKDAGQRAYRSPKEALERLNELGLGGRRALPMFDQREKDAGSAESRFRTPQRRLGPILRLRSRDGQTAKQITIPHDKPLIVNGRNPERPNSHAFEQLSLLSCQVKDWYVYNLSTRPATWHNSQPVFQHAPRRLKAEDEVRFGDERYLVDLILQGTGIIKGFDLLKRIHRGSGGDLYLARWYRRDLKQQMAVVRLLPQEFGSDVDQIRRFLRAIPSAGRIKHPNVVRLYKGGRVRRSDGSTWFIASEFMRRRSLRDRLKRSRGKGVSLKRAQAIAMGVANALSAARNHRVIHRNINPACIMFDAGQRVKLGDFSLLRTEVMESMFDVTRGKLLPGDYLYQSPEVLAASPDVDYACDFYSLGVCLYEAILGKPPIDPNQPEISLIRNLVNYEWPAIRDLKNDVPKAWEDALNRCLNRDPSQRYRSPEALKEAFAGLPTV